MKHVVDGVVLGGMLIFCVLSFMINFQAMGRTPTTTLLWLAFLLYSIGGVVWLARREHGDT